MKALAIFLISSAAASAAGPAAAPVPRLAGPFERVFAPAGGRYLNDHTLARGPDGLWHLFAIASPDQGSVDHETSLLHATAPRLTGPWTEHEDVIRAEEALNERFSWAPHVVEWEPGRWLMYYWAEWVRPEPSFRGLRRADSHDLFHWTKAEATDTPALRPPGGRDPFLMKLGDRWLLYSVGVDDFHGQIVVTETREIADARAASWSSTVAVTTDPVASFGWGNLESPFVKERCGWWFLFTTRTGPHDPDVADEYLDEIVLRSRDPRRFDWAPVAGFRAHAAEIVSEDGRDYITSAGWTSVIGEPNRGLKIAPLEWVREGRRGD